MIDDVTIFYASNCLHHIRPVRAQRSLRRCARMQPWSLQLRHVCCLTPNASLLHDRRCNPHRGDVASSLRVRAKVRRWCGCAVSQRDTKGSVVSRVKRLPFLHATLRVAFKLSACVAHTTPLQRTERPPGVPSLDLSAAGRVATMPRLALLLLSAAFFALVDAAQVQMGVTPRPSARGSFTFGVFEVSRPRIACHQTLSHALSSDFHASGKSVRLIS